MLDARHPAIQLAVVAVLLSVVPRAAVAEDQSDVRTLTRAYNASGQMLFHQFSAGNGNIVFSPYSIGTAMAMVLAGTRG
jgi:serine protease inhibitor